jgi:coenzyme F420-reducing hydrogenase gamma subunit
LAFDLFSLFLIQIPQQNYPVMKKVILMGSLCLALGMASCKTYCPAYNYATVETPAQENTSADAPAEVAAEVANS